MKKIYCVTGPMAAGKNAASSFFEKNGFACIDADLLGHRAVELKKEKILETLKEEASKKNVNLLNKDGSLSRESIAKIVFSNPELLQKHEAIVFPEINWMLEEFCEKNKDSSIIINATVLYKVPLIKKISRIIYIDAPLHERFVRAKKRGHMSALQILERFSSQRNLFAKYKISNADTERVWNTGSKSSLEEKLRKFL